MRDLCHPDRARAWASGRGRGLHGRRYRPASAAHSGDAEPAAQGLARGRRARDEHSRPADPRGRQGVPCRRSRSRRWSPRIAISPRMPPPWSRSSWNRSRRWQALTRRSTQLTARARHAVEQCHCPGAHAQGDAAAVFASGVRMLRHRFDNHRYAAMPIECRGVAAWYDTGSDSITVWSSTQVVHWVRREVAARLKLPELRVRCIAPEVGGDSASRVTSIPRMCSLLLLPAGWAARSNGSRTGTRFSYRLAGARRVLGPGDGVRPRRAHPRGARPARPRQRRLSAHGIIQPYITATTSRPLRHPELSARGHHCLHQQDRRSRRCAAPAARGRLRHGAAHGQSARASSASIRRSCADAISSARADSLCGRPHLSRRQAAHL